MIKFLTSLDIFSLRYNFLRNGKESEKTEKGLIISIIYLFIVIGLFMGFGIDLYTRKNPKVSFNSILKSHEKVSLSNDKFIFAYRIEDMYGLEVRDDSIINLSMYFFNYELIDGKWNLTSQELDVPKVRCSDIPNINTKEKYYNLSLSSWYCVDFTNRQLGGYWDGNFLNCMSILAKVCTNTTNNKCLSKEEITYNFKPKTDLASTYFFSYLYTETIPTMNDYNEPIKTTLINRYDVLDLKVAKKHIHNFKEVQILDDRGWIFSEVYENSFFSSDNILNDFSLNLDREEKTLFGYIMYFGKRRETYHKSYIKVQEVIASIGGFSKFFHVLVSIIYNHIGEVHKILNYINECSENLDTINLESKSNASNLQSIDHLKLSPFLNIKQERTKMKFYKTIKYLTCKKNKNSIHMINEYNFEKRYFYKKLDIISYLKFCNEFDIIKMILFDEYQIKALSLIKNDHSIIENNNKEQLINELKEYYDKLNQTKLSKINNKIFDILKPIDGIIEKKNLHKSNGFLKKENYIMINK